MACTSSSALITFGGRLFAPGGLVLSTTDGSVQGALPTDARALLVTDDLLVTRTPKGTEWRDPATLEVRARRRDWWAGPAAITSRGTLLTAGSRPEGLGDRDCMGDCDYDIDQVQEWSARGEPIAACHGPAESLVVGPGRLWTTSSKSRSFVVSLRHSYDAAGVALAPRGWVTPYGGPGRGNRPR